MSGRPAFVFSRVAYDCAGQRDAGLLLEKARRFGSPVPDPANVELDPRLGKARGERLVTEKFASAFHGTRLRLILRAKHVNTVIVCGCTTSGCVRATVVDAL